MICPKCNAQTNSPQFCTQCGENYNEAERALVSASPDVLGPDSLPVKRKFGVASVIRIIAILILLGVGIYNQLNDRVVQKNNDAISSYDSGDTQNAIMQLESAVNSATSDETKIETLKNLAYVYTSEQQNDKALENFKKALALTDADSFNNHLIAGEVALLEKRPLDAEKEYLAAEKMEENNFQANNALGLFYLDLEQFAPESASPAKAVPYLQKAYAENPKESVRLNLGIGYVMQADYDSAVLLLSKADFTKEPYNALWLGLAFMKKDDEPNARIYFQRAKDLGAELPASIQEYLDQTAAAVSPT